MASSPKVPAAPSVPLPQVGPGIEIQRVANGYLVDTHPTFWRGRDPREIETSRMAEWFVFETFESLVRWLGERFQHREEA